MKNLIILIRLICGAMLLAGCAYIFAGGYLMVETTFNLDLGGWNLLLLHETGDGREFFMPTEPLQWLFIQNYSLFGISLIVFAAWLYYLVTRYTIPK